jgi:hypothetical protein
VVIEMKRTELKTKGSLTQKLLRLLKADSGLQECSSLQDATVAGGLPGKSCHGYHVRSRALLEAEQKKAEALMERQKHPLIY